MIIPVLLPRNILNHRDIVHKLDRKTYCSYPTPILIIAEALAIFWHLVVASKKAGDSVKTLVSGRLASYFWVNVAGVGLLLPLILDIIGTLALSESTKLGVSILASICLLVGGLLLRWLVLFAGIRMTLYVRTQFQMRPEV